MQRREQLSAGVGGRVAGGGGLEKGGRDGSMRRMKPSVSSCSVCFCFANPAVTSRPRFLRMGQNRHPDSGSDWLHNGVLDGGPLAA